ncbi:MAG TPA: hypothetical protein VIS73_13015, partial [Rhodocyclaceae bacterium]
MGVQPLQAAGRRAAAATLGGAIVKIIASRALVGLLWCLHWLPLPVMRALGAGVGRLLYRFAGRRRRIAEINLRLC